MKTYEVTLMATSYKTVNICSESEADALMMAQDMYFTTDALDFTDDDVDEVVSQADEVEESKTDDDDVYSEIQENIDESVRESYFALDDLVRAMESLQEYYEGK